VSFTVSSRRHSLGDKEFVTPLRSLPTWRTLLRVRLKIDQLGDNGTCEESSL
jgi:hypothetical protein